MIGRFLTGEPLRSLAAVCSSQDIVKLQEQCREIYIHSELLNYMVAVIHATRKHRLAQGGVSPRGTLAFVRAAQGYAMTEGRDYVVPEDIKAVAVPVLAHRLSLSIEGGGRRTAVSVINEILQNTPLPTEDWARR